MRTIIVFSLISFLIFPLIAFTQIEEAPDVPVMTVLNRIVNWVFSIFLVVAVLFIIIAAFYFVTAQGKPEQINQAKNFLLWAVIGVVVAVASRGLVQWIRGVIEK